MESSTERQGKMKIGAFQFAGSGDMEYNFAKISEGIRQAAGADVRFLAFHECALTGYPPLEVSMECIDFEAAEKYCAQVQTFAVKYRMYIALGCAVRRGGRIFNSVRVFSPRGGELPAYDKRALWGWDRENFYEGGSDGIYDIDGLRIGIRICFEVRFPEYFRELYRQGADLGVVCFCDISETENADRYELIKAHLRTRAVENVMPVLAVNDAGPFQTAPTAFFDRDGKVFAECRRNETELLVWEVEKLPDTFGQAGRKYVNGRLSLSGPHHVSPCIAQTEGTGG